MTVLAADDKSGRQTVDAAEVPQTKTDEEIGAIRPRERVYESISPFEFKNELIRLARKEEKKSSRAMLDAGRGNPNWIAATPREAFFTLGLFAMEECRRVWDEGDLAGKPDADGISRRLKQYLRTHGDLAGAGLLGAIVDLGPRVYGFDPDEWVHELVDGVVGDNYPMPDRMLVHLERIVHDFMVRELCGGDCSAREFKLFAVEGATAAMCYLFDSLEENCLLQPGDKVAVMVPIFPPYVEIPHLAKYAFDVVEVRATAVDREGRHTWQYPDRELEKLRDPTVRALFVVNPSNPPSVAIARRSVALLKEIVQKDNPDLMIISDDVYGTFVDGYRSLLADLPYNTACVYSFSKYFGVTGWRLGVIAVERDNVFDHRLARLPAETKRKLDSRYASMTAHTRELLFIDRLVADSRQVALNHTAGLSTPQQVQMACFAAFALLDRENRYRRLTRDICHRRMRLLYEGLELPLPDLPHDADYYTEFDLDHWARRHYGADFADYLQAHYDPQDILIRLAEESSIVLLNGGGFYGPKWSLRVSLANLNDAAYAEIGQKLHRALEIYVKEWRSFSTGRLPSGDLIK